MKINRNSLSDNRLYFSPFVKGAPLLHSPFVKGVPLFHSPFVKGIPLFHSPFMKGGLRGIFINIIIIFLLLSCSKTYIIPSYNQVSDADLHPIIISDQVGESIDSLERKNYNLFPGVENFYSAHIHTIPEKGFVLDCTITDNTQYRSVIKDPMGLEILRDHINNYDSIMVIRTGLMKDEKGDKDYKIGKDPFEMKWGIVGYDDDLNLPITREEITLYGQKNNMFKMGKVCCCLGIGFSTAYLIALGDYKEHGPFGESDITFTEIIPYLAGATVASVAGIYLSRMIEKDMTIQAIKAGRKLKQIE